MGPLILVDKSFIESLNREEVDALHKHYTVCVCTMLLKEILGDLVKSKYTPNEATARVIGLATKAHGMLSDNMLIPDFRDLIAANLFGQKIGDVPGIPRFGGREVIAPDGSKGVIFDQESEEEALLKKWKSGQFSVEDKKLAEEHSKELDEYDLPATQVENQTLYPNNTRFKTLEEVAESYSLLERNPDTMWEVIKIQCKYCHLPDEKIQEFRQKWEGAGRPALKELAPYADFCSRAMNLYFIGITAGLVLTGKKHKTLIDIFYFFNLPFVSIFCSGDKFHRDHFKYFARPDQEFIWAPDLKADLKNIASFHKNMTSEDKRQYEVDFGHYPPPMQNSITRNVWEKYCAPWKLGSGNKVLARTDEENKKEHEELMKLFKSFKGVN